MSPADSDDQRYRALCAHDARFDGRFFVGVTSTGIYCRPVCRVRVPRRTNCRFFDLAAQAEGAGFRPCLRCRPELAPRDRHWSTEDAGAILAQQATALLDDPQIRQAHGSERAAMLWLAQRMGVSDRHLRRIFEQQLGVSPLQYLQTRKLLTAKQLLADTTLPVSQVALTSGFGSVRRFNAAIRDRYGLSPSQMRHGARSGASLEAGSSRARLFWRPPLDVNALLGFLAQRQLPGMERVDTVALSLTRSLRFDVGAAAHRGWLRAQFQPERCAVDIVVSEGLQEVLPQVLWRLRALFDLDADPQAINTCLSAEFPGGDGLRVPGCVDGFELAVRAVLGQQITVAAARTLAQRLLEHFGEAIATPDPQVHRLFPTPKALAAADAEQLGAIGILRQRQAAIQALARAVADSTLDLSGQSDLKQTLHVLQSLPGFGPWTAQYIAMRALRWPDAWPVGDVAVHQALGLNPVRGTAATRTATDHASAWQPWRSYAVVRAWAGCHASQSTKDASP
jgi:AraC family transcriptional regulator, regulatory protein of adaptative response / DNA-3-methyladenine glycosylase II